MAAVPGPGFLCFQCSKASGSDPFKKPAAPKRKKASKADKRNVVYFDDKKFPTLVSMCIQVYLAVLIMEGHEFISLQLITKHIDDVEALGDIGTINMDAISKALSKARSLYVRFPPSCSSSLNCDFQDARERPAILYIN